MGGRSDPGPDSHLPQMREHVAVPSAGGDVFCPSGEPMTGPPNDAVRVWSQPASEDDSMDHMNTPGGGSSRLSQQPNGPAPLRPSSTATPLIRR